MTHTVTLTTAELLVVRDALAQKAARHQRAGSADYDFGRHKQQVAEIDDLLDRLPTGDEAEVGL